MKPWIIFAVLVAGTFCYIEEENDDMGGLLFAGDMMLTPEQRAVVEKGGDFSNNHQSREKRATMSDVRKLWLENNKTVAYTMDSDLESEPEATMGLMKAFREWEERSCISFKRREQEVDYINFFNQSGCWSYVGRQGGKQNISLEDGCWGIGTVVHEIGHAMGFGHEQNRPDRDKYIKVRWENVPEPKRHNFNKYNDSTVDSLNSTYDYKSFMQYSKKAFGINDSITLDPTQEDIFQLGQRVGFTESDQYQAMKLYKCNGKTTRKTSVYEKYTALGDDVCDFDNGLCHYTQDSTDDFDWSRRYGPTPSGDTGPDSDHTTERLGVFVYIEASLPRKEGDTARLMSKVFPETQNQQCLRFYLHMFAKGKTMMGDFNVYLKDNNGQVPILQKSGSQAINGWTKIQMTFKPIGEYQVIFEGIRGRDYQGDIAIDDVSFNDKVCMAEQNENNVQNDAIPSGECYDTKDRENQYCKQWKDAQYCNTKETYMRKFCMKTCNFC